MRFEFRYHFNISPFCGPGYLKIINFLLCAVYIYRSLTLQEMSKKISLPHLQQDVFVVK